jgi:hypothetical protein
MQGEDVMRGLRMGWVVCVLLAGCETLEGPAGPRNGVPVDPPGGGGGGGGGAAEAIIARQCTWCHTAAYPAAGIDLETDLRLSPAHLDDFARGVQLEMAPFVEKLSAADKRTLLDWVRARGATVPAATIPSRYTWNLNEHLADKPEGAAAPGFAFVLEDAFIDTAGWTVRTYTDRNGRTYKGIHLGQTHQIDQSVFSSSRNPSSYLVFAGVPWHGRFYNSRMEGDVRVGRWMSIGMHARTMHPTGRSNREYVRLQLDRDAISLRSAPTPLETWPWGNQPDPRLHGTTDASGFYQTSNEWLHFVFEARRESGGTRWTALVTDPASGEVMANLSALETDPNPLQGTFFLHAYSTGDDRMWANLVFTADVDPRN